MCKGRGIGKTVIQKHQEEFEKRGITVFPGTLNVLLKEPVFLDLSLADFQIEQTWFVFQAKINGHPCHIFRFPKCPDHIFEILADIKLSDFLPVFKGGEVNIKIDKKYLKKNTKFSCLFWLLFWSGRRNAYYNGNLYPFFVGKYIDLKYSILKKIKSITTNACE